LSKNPKFIETLIDKGIITQKDYEFLSRNHKGDDFELLQRLCKGFRGGTVSSMELASMWGDSIGFPYLELSKTLFQPEIVQRIDEDFARKNKIIPIYKFGEVITAATINPNNRSLIYELESRIGCEISPVFALLDEIEDAIEVQYSSSQALEELTQIFKVRGKDDKFHDYMGDFSDEQLIEIADDQAVIDLVRGLLIYAFKEKASDIHIQPSENSIHIRMRIDGVLHEKFKLEKSTHLPMVSCLKIMAGMNIAERRKPQDGRMSLQLAHKSVHFRLSSIPSVNGEKIVLRILGQMSEKGIPDLDDLDFSEKNLELMRSLLETPNGVVFVTGPTGSGKTTTLFSALKYINKPGINILTIEDPIEYFLKGATQVQTNPKIGLNFATALRGFLRQDPDVILVGEVRDMETAKIASQAALTGHLVMSTMHTNNAFQAVTRLIDIGVEPFLVAPSVIGIMAQRLVRRLCEACKKRYLLSEEEMQELFIGNYTKGFRRFKIHFYKAVGCKECDHVGYKGRIGIHELFIIDNKMRESIAKNESILHIQQRALRSGFQTLRYDGVKKVIRGLTTIEEIDKISYRHQEMYTDPEETSSPTE